MAGETGELLERPTKELLADFGAGKASPGSGSAAALMGLLAAKLLITVCDKSMTKQECRANHKIIAYIKQQVEVIEPRLVELFEKDAREFDEVVKLRVARDAAKSSKEREKFSKQSKELLETATDNAFNIIDLCLKLIDHAVVVFRSGWPAVRGDSGAAISAAIAGVMSGIFIANLNLKNLRGRKYAAENIARCDGVYKELAYKQAEAFSCVTSLNAEALASIQLEIEETRVT
ncbi:cyclodeaminase/cyclohydrolase family protein [Pseudoxanthomonas winnipegensis]|uniref:cyclodeaminase/cyclohydrolase family protein n=1 Tax=Pseudoxanthomonas winnipegensis TaxID=2480810 RepID=UPI0030F47638